MFCNIINVAKVSPITLAMLQKGEDKKHRVTKPLLQKIAATKYLLQKFSTTRPVLQ